MKTKIVILISLLAVEVYAGKLVEADKQDIGMLHHAAVELNSAYTATYIGETHGRVYFEFVTGIHSSSLVSNKPKYMIYWCKKEKIPKEMLQDIIEAKIKNLEKPEEDEQPATGGDATR